MEVDPPKILLLLHDFLAVQQRRAEAYSKLKREFSDYMATGGELAYTQLCGEMTIKFNDYSKKVLEVEGLFKSSDYRREDLAHLLRAVQDQEKQNLHLTVTTIQMLKKAGHFGHFRIGYSGIKFFYGGAGRRYEGTGFRPKSLDDV